MRSSQKKIVAAYMATIDQEYREAFNKRLDREAYFLLGKWVGARELARALGCSDAELFLADLEVNHGRQ
jgi:hypothetical protein